eukprot:TRINITY_DN3386_c0_g1_i1.p1 TRINITY_DN3386_c0_g1~~TRINITY_DN3386_c0_g1_i1.p1  ORF type:complete len:268 (+),score=36.95 TRINITY_DN3386_c0_g1_i1:75-878(+)
MEVQALFSVHGKVALVTGGGRGIGQYIADGLVSNGCTVYIVSRDASVCQKIAEELTQKGPGRCIALPSIDFAKSGSHKQLGEALAEKGVDKLHILVNNSGVSWGEPLEKYSEAGWDKVMNINVKALFYVTREVLPLLKATATIQDPARIINIGSIAGIQHQLIPTYAYDISKAAVHHLTRKFADEFSRDFITANAIAPGFIPSKMSGQLFTYVDKETIASNIPLKRLGSPTDMAGIVLYLSSPAGAWVTGTLIPVDGGHLVGRGASL